MKTMCAIFACLLAFTAYAAPVPTQPRQATVKQITGATAQTIVLDGAKDITIHPTTDKKQTVMQDGVAKKVFPNSNAITITYTGDFPKPGCGVKPPDATRQVQCGAGFDGGPWTQTQGTQCNLTTNVWDVLPWTPATAPVGTCTPHGIGHPPTPNFSFIVTGNSVAFTGTRNSDDDGWIVGWNWNFGDGSAHSTDQNPVHVYAAAGTYTVTQTATDNDGLSATGSKPVTVGGVTPPPQCGAIPADAAEDKTCSSGTGTYHRTHGWTQGPPPGCTLTALPWVPATEPAGCGVVVPPPPAGPLKFNLTPDHASQPYIDYKWVVDNGDNDDRGMRDEAFMFHFGENATYCAAAGTMTDAYVTLVEGQIASGSSVDLANDSYLYAGDNISALSIVYAFCPNIATTLKTRIANINNQAIYNIWHPNDAHWGTRLVTWSGWSVDNAGNNYFYRSFWKASIFWSVVGNPTDARYNGKTLAAYLATEKTPMITTYFNAIPGGGSYEGTGYMYSLMELFEDYKWLYDSNGVDVRNPHMVNTGKLIIQMALPDMGHVYPIGSQSRVSSAPMSDYTRKGVNMASYLSTDAQLKGWASWWNTHIKDEDGDPYTKAAWRFMRFYDNVPGLTGAAPIEPDKTWASKEVGIYTARTSWSDPAAVFAGFYVGPYIESHMHSDAGGYCFAGTDNPPWLSCSNVVNEHSGVNGESGGSSKHTNAMMFFDRNGAELKQKMNTSPVVVSYTGNVTTGEAHMVVNMTAMYDPASVTKWQRTFDFVNSKLTITDVVIMAGGATSKAQVQTNVAPNCSGQNCTAGKLHVAIISPTPAQTNTVNLSAIDSDFNSNAGVIQIGCSAGCKFELTRVAAGAAKQAMQAVKSVKTDKVSKQDQKRSYEAHH